MLAPLLARCKKLDKESRSWVHQIDKSIAKACLGLEINGQVDEVLDSESI